MFVYTQKIYFFFFIFLSLSFSLNVTILHKWVQMDYDWVDMGEDKNQWISEGLFIAENCILAGIKMWEDTIYVSIPRWAPGVPATLNKIVERNGIPLLLPFPPVNEQMINTTTGLKNVQDVEIDPYGRMWVVDTGALNFYFPEDYVYNPPRILVYDLTVNPPMLLQEFTFSQELAPPNNVFLNDIVIDVINDFAYLTNSVGNGGLYVYDYKNNKARFWTDESTQIESNEEEFNIQDSGVYFIDTPSDGIALSVDISTLYYCALSGIKLYSIPTELFRNFSTTSEQLHNSVTYHGDKLSKSDGIVIDSNNIMYFGNIEGNNINVWDPSLLNLTDSNQDDLTTSNPNYLQWQDTFAFDGHGSLILVTNRLQLFPTNYDFTGNSGYNFHILSIDIGSNSYMQGTLNYYGE